jgi:hypothetical protein
MGNSPSKEEVEDLKQESTVVGIITGYVLLGVVILAIIIVFFKYGYENREGIKFGLKSVSSVSSQSIDWTKITTIMTPVLLVAMMVYYFWMALEYKISRGKYRSRPESISELLAIRRGIISNRIDPLARVTNSVCSALTASPRKAPYNQIHKNGEGGGDERSLVNWRPLTVRLTGYLGGINGALDGVFDMDAGVRHSLNLGARSFFFDIDYLEARPCEPTIIFRDDTGIMRSLHTGSIKDGMKVLADNAFLENYDPVLIIIYLRRIPPGVNQQSLFFKSIAAALDPLSANHLGLTDNGNYHNCTSESQLFTSPIVKYQKKFIVITNYNTSILPRTSNPKDNLHYWTNGRIYQDPSGTGAVLGKVTEMPPTAPAAVAQVGSSTQFLNIGSNDKPAFQKSSINVFKIALAAPDYKYSVAELNTLLNELGVQCVPMDVLRYGSSAEHAKTLDHKVNPILATSTRLPGTLAELSKPTNLNDPLSFWTYGGWSWKNIIQSEAKQGFMNYEGFEEKAPVKPTEPIPGFVIPNPQVPKKPSSTLNSNGGLVNVA